MNVTDARRMGSAQAKARGTACHFRGTACHAHIKSLISLHKSSQGKFIRNLKFVSPQHAELVRKNINHGRNAALLRQV